ncbi:MAG TPA: DUF4129 domain-containing protein [Caulobacteraceae bacterium]
MAPDTAAGGITGAPDEAALRAAHARLIGDKAIQFSFAPQPKIAPIHLPDWLKALARAIGAVVRAASPLATYLFWVGLGLAAVVVLYVIAREVFGVRFGRRRRATARPSPADWRPEAFRARALLADADRLAALGRYDEAIHLLLFRSIDEIEDRRPHLVRPALTSRDIAALEALPEAARTTFAKIAQVVERSLFGGRPAQAASYAECRTAYEAFAFPQVWA